MSTVSIQQYIKKQIQASQTVRNGKYPDAGTQGAMSALINQAAMWRTKEAFRFGCSLAAIPAATVVARSRWRFAYRSGRS